MNISKVENNLLKFLSFSGSIYPDGGYKSKKLERIESVHEIPFKYDKFIYKTCKEGCRRNVDILFDNFSKELYQFIWDDNDTYLFKHSKTKSWYILYFWDNTLFLKEEDTLTDLFKYHFSENEKYMLFLDIFSEEYGYKNLF